MVDHASLGATSAVTAIFTVLDARARTSDIVASASSALLAATARIVFVCVSLKPVMLGILRVSQSGAALMSEAPVVIC